MESDQATLTVTGAPASEAYAISFVVSTEGGSGTGAVSFSVTDACSNTNGGASITMTAGTGTCGITATKAADGNNNATTSAAVSVSATTAAQATLTVSGPSAVTYGTTGTAAAAGICVLTATQAGDTNYAGATSAPFAVTLNKAAQATLTVTGPSAVAYGTTGTTTARRREPRNTSTQPQVATMPGYPGCPDFPRRSPISEKWP